MKWIKYKTQVESTMERGAAEDGTPITETVLCSTMRTVPYSEENETIAKEQAYNGEYTVEDDGEEETTPSTTLENRVDTLEAVSAEMAEALNMILNGVTE